MRNKVEKTVIELQKSWQSLSMPSIYKIQSALESLARDPEVQSQLQAKNQNHPKGVELHRDPAEGFVLMTYSEVQGTYRMPHDHGQAWVVYVVISGEMEMGSYLNAVRADGSSHLVLKKKEKLAAGDTRIYFPGEIHDTRCVSENAVILRLTSLDLKDEEGAGRMKRYQNEEA